MNTTSVLLVLLRASIRAIQPLSMPLGDFITQWLSHPVSFRSFKQLVSGRQPQIARFIGASPINVQHAHLRQLRLQVPRNHCIPHVYFKFLRELYPLDGVLRHKALYGAYTHLPSPQPLYVQPHHFEHLLECFTGAQGVNRSQVGDLFRRISNGVKNCGMELSHKEQNAMLYLCNYDERNIVNIKRQWSELLEDDNDRLMDISTANIFLRYAAKHENYLFLKEILDLLNDRGLRLDRMSYDIVLGFMGKSGMVEEATSLLKSILSDGIVFDVSMMNTVIDTLVELEDLDAAEQVVQISMDTSVRSKEWENFKRRQYTYKLQYLDSLKLQTLEAPLFIPSPTFETFSPLIRHCASLTQFTPYKLIGYLECMHECCIPIPLHLSKHIVQCLTHHNSIDVDQMRHILSLLQRGTERLDHQLIQSVLSLFQNPVFDRLVALDLERGWKTTSDGSMRPNLDVEELSRHTLQRVVASI